MSPRPRVNRSRFAVAVAKLVAITILALGAVALPPFQSVLCYIAAGALAGKISSLELREIATACEATAVRGAAHGLKPVAYVFTGVAKVFLGLAFACGSLGGAFAEISRGVKSIIARFESDATARDSADRAEPPVSAFPITAPLAVDECDDEEGMARATNISQTPADEDTPPD